MKYLNYSSASTLQNRYRFLLSNRKVSIFNKGYNHFLASIAGPAAAIGTTSSLSSTTLFSNKWNGQYQNSYNNKNGTFAIFGIGLGAAGYFAATNASHKAHCESEETKQQQQEQTQTQTPLTPWKEDIQEDDEFYDVDSEDGETYCSLCIMHRQGPCRLPWKRVEACMKKYGNKSDDNEQNNNNDGSSASTEDEKKKEGSSSSSGGDNNQCYKYFWSFTKCASENYAGMQFIMREVAEMEYIKYFIDNLLQIEKETDYKIKVKEMCWDEKGSKVYPTIVEPTITDVDDINWTTRQQANSAVEEIKTPKEAYMKSYEIIEKMKEEQEEKNNNEQANTTTITPLQFDNNLEFPVMIEGNVPIPIMITNEETVSVLEGALVLDQHDNCCGGFILKEQDDKKDDQKQPTEEEEGKGEEKEDNGPELDGIFYNKAEVLGCNKDHLDLSFMMLPGFTKSIKVRAIYATIPKDFLFNYTNNNAASSSSQQENVLLASSSHNNENVKDDATATSNNDDEKQQLEAKIIPDKCYTVYNTKTYQVQKLKKQ